MRLTLNVQTHLMRDGPQEAMPPHATQIFQILPDHQYCQGESPCTVQYASSSSRYQPSAASLLNSKEVTGFYHAENKQLLCKMDYSINFLKMPNVYEMR